MTALRFEAEHGTTTGGGDSKGLEDRPVRSFRLDEVPDLVGVAGMGVGSGDGHPGIGLKGFPERAPGSGVSRGPKGRLDAGKQCVGQKGDKEMRPGPVGSLVIDRTNAQVALERAEGVFHPGQGDVERPDPGGGKIRMGRLDYIGSREIFPDRSLFSLFPDEVGDPGERGFPGGEFFLLFPLGRFEGSPGDRDRGDLIVAGHGGMGGLDLSEASADRLPLGQCSFPDGGAKLFQRRNEPGFLEGVHPLFLELAGLRKHQGPNDRGIVGEFDLLEPDAGLGSLRIGGEPRKVLLRLFELLPVGFFRRPAFDHAIREPAHLHQVEVLPGRDPPVHDECGLGKAQARNGGDQKALETVEHGGKSLWLGLVSRIDPADHGATLLVHDEREGDEGAVAPLLFRVAPSGEGIPPCGSLEVGIGQIVEEHHLPCGGGGADSLRQTRFDGLLRAPESVGDRIEGILPDIEEPAIDHLRQAGAGGEPAVGRKIASGSDEPADDHGTGQSDLPMGEAGRQKDLGKAQLFPGRIGDKLGTGRAAVQHLDAVGSQDGRSPGPGGGGIGLGPPLLAVNLLLPEDCIDDGQKLRVSDAGKKGEAGKPCGKEIGQNLSPGGIEIQATQMEQDPVAGSLLRLDGLDELMGNVERAGLFVPDAGFPNIQEISG